MKNRRNASTVIIKKKQTSELRINLLKKKKEIMRNPDVNVKSCPT